MQQALRGRFSGAHTGCFSSLCLPAVLDLEAARKQQQNSLKTGLTRKDKLLSVGPKWIYRKVTLERP